MAGMSALRVLVACEYSGRVREAFRARGHDAWSCDLLPAEDGSEHHLQHDCLEVMWRGWDLMLAFPPCTHLAVSGARHFAAKRADGRQQAALQFVRNLMQFPGPWAVENPVSIVSSHVRKPDQVIQPWMFGHPGTKATCLWLSGLPALKPTNNVREEMAALPPSLRNRIHRMPPGPDRWKERSRTFAGIADAMADQWGGYMAERQAA